MDPSFEELLDYVFGSLSKKRHKEIEEFIGEFPIYKEIIEELISLKQELEDKNKIKRFLEEKKKRIGKKLFPDWPESE